ncbi:unnamed protein product [Closterium sp. NIES-65]|nr:unnamed protein product [Closterium sp. NIES-65]
MLDCSQRLFPFVPHPLFPSSVIPIFRYPITYSRLPISPPNQLDFKASSQIWQADKLDFKLMLGCSQLSTPYPLIPVFIFTILNFKAAFIIWCVDKLDFMVILGCFLGIIFSSPEIGLLVASVLSVLKLLLRIVCPHIRLLGLLSLLPSGAATAVSVLQFPNSTLCEGIVMLRIESPLYFPAANFCRQRIKKLCDAYARGYQQPVRHCILDLSVMHDIDVSSIDGLKELHRDLSEKSIQHRSPFTGVPSGIDGLKELCEIHGMPSHYLSGMSIQIRQGGRVGQSSPPLPLALAPGEALCLSSASRDVLRKLWDANFLAEMGEQWLFVTPADAVKLCRSVAVAAPAVKELM